MKAFKSIAVLFLLLLTIQCLSQRRVRTQKPDYRVFEAGIILGGNLAQLDGDFFTGYDNSGYYGGLRGIANIAPQISLLVEMLYSQKGSKIPHGVRLTSQRSVNDRIIDLNYAEVPIVLKMKLNRQSFTPYVEVGVSYARLINSEVQEKSPDLIDGTVYNNLVDAFRSTDLGIVTGFGFTANRKLDVGMRLSFSFTRLYNAENPVEFNPLSGIPREVEFLRNYHLSLFAGYIFL